MKYIAALVATAAAAAETTQKAFEAKLTNTKVECTGATVNAAAASTFDKYTTVKVDTSKAADVWTSVKKAETAACSTFGTLSAMSIVDKKGATMAAMTAAATGLWGDAEKLADQKNCIEAAGWTVPKDTKNVEKFTDADDQKKYTDGKYPSGGAFGTVSAYDADAKVSQYLLVASSSASALAAGAAAGLVAAAIA